MLLRVPARQTGDIPTVNGFLAQVCAAARRRVDAVAAQEPLAALRRRGEATSVPPALLDALRPGDVSVIAEVKRSSPSRGALADIADPAGLAQAYASGGAAAISVLTEPEHFRGSLDDLQAVVAAVGAPVLRKDFVVDEYQVWEARAAGAAAILLIVAALEQDELAALLECVQAAGMAALLETHDELEVTRAVGAYEAAGITGRPVIGVNARDMTTLEVDPHRFEALRPAIPDGAVAVAESGVRSAEDVRRVAGLGADAVLVGESVATAADPAAAVAAMVAAGQHGAEVRG
ncbi:MAG: indole-3-glycerol-phosphate synthase TrpC [Nitriliruptorales bacterium]|nr:indole-3-glycerol-phosphate synthase TrpC [Nitriliruptorales bacterium]